MTGKYCILRFHTLHPRPPTSEHHDQPYRHRVISGSSVAGPAACRLEESLRKYIKSVSCHQRCWISEKRIFDKRVELVLALEERDQIIQQPILPDTVKIRDVDGS